MYILELYHSYCRPRPTCILCLKMKNDKDLFN